MTILSRLEMENFKSHKSTVIDFKIGRVIILGENGAGKSSVEQAIAYALFGVVDGYQIADLAGTGGSRFKVTLNFEVGGKKYRVERVNGQGGKPEATLIAFESDYTGKRRNIAEDQTRVNYEILRIMGALGEAGKELRNYVIVPQNQIQTIISDRPGDRKNFFDNLFGISDYETTRVRLAHMKKVFQSRLEAFQKIISQKKESMDKLPEVQAKREQLQEQIVVATKNLADISGQYSEKETKYKQLEKIASEIQTLKARISQINEHLANLETRRVQDFTKLTQTYPESIPKMKEIEKAPMQTLQTKFSRELNSYKVKIDAQSKAIEGLTGRKSQLEEKIRQKGKVEKEINAKTGEITKLSTSLQVKAREFSWLKPPEKTWVKQVQERIERINADYKELKDIEKKVHLFIAALEKNSVQVAILEKTRQEYEQKILKERKTLEKSFLKGKQLPEFETQISAAADQELLKKLTAQQKAIGKKVDTNQKNIARLEENVQINSTTIQELRALPGEGICPHCKQKISEQHKNEEIEKLEVKNSQLSNSITEKQQNFETLTAQMTQVEEEIKQFQENEKILTLFLNEKKHIEELEQDKNAATNHVVVLKNSVNSVTTELKQTIVPFKFIEFGIQGESVEPSIDREMERITDEKEKSTELVQVVSTLNDKKSQLDKIQQDLRDLEISIKNLSTDFSDEMLKSAEKTRSDLRTKYDQLAELIGKLNLLLQIITQIQSSKEDLEGRQKELKIQEDYFDPAIYLRLQEELKQLNDTKTSLTAKVEEWQKNSLPQLLENIHLLEKAKDEYEDAKRQSELYGTVNKDLEHYVRFFQEVQGHVRLRFVQQTSQEATSLFREMVEMPEFSEIKIDEDYNLQVLRFNQWEKLSRLSGGEKMIMSLAIRIAIASRLGKQDLILLDEPTESLDSERIQTFVDCFERKSPLSQIFIITHDREFERVADQVIRVTKDMGHSKLEVVTE